MDIETKDQKPMHAGHGYTRTVIEHHDDGSHTITHHHSDGHADTYARHGIDDLHDGLEEHMGSPNDGEEAEDHEHASHSELLKEIEDLVHKFAAEERAEGE